MGKSVCIWAFFILLLHKQRVDVCRASICSPPCLLILNSSNIIALDYETSDITSIKSGLSEAVTLDFHFRLGYIYWSDLIELSIKRFSIDKGITKTVIVNTGVCTGLAVEWRTSRLYWTDITFNMISVSDVDGLNQHSLITKLEEPRDIALDPDSGLMFWADWSRGVYPKIKRASLNGSQIMAIVTVNLQQPTGINLDRRNRRIFWVNSRISTVESVDYDGDNRRVLFKQSGLQPFGLAFSPPFLFLTAWQTLKQVYQLDAITGNLLRSYSINNQKPMDIVAYDESRQPPAANPCSVNNGGCSHFCVLKTSGYECVCSTGLALKQDGKRCQEKVKNFVLFTDSEARSINMISLDVNYSIAQPLLNHLYDQRPTAVDFDPVEDRLYWSDVEKGRIMSAFTNATSVKTLFSCNVLKPSGLAIDRVGRNIYWTDAGTNRIEVGRLDGTKRKLLFENKLEEPRTIVLYEKNGIMVWTAWGPKPNIAKAQMDGSGRHTIVTGNLSKPDGLTIDRVTNFLYWADSQQDTIEMSDLNGGHRQVILSSAAGIKPFRLVFYQDALYWTDPNYKRIEFYDLVDGKRKTIALDSQKPTDIHIYDPSMLYSDSHPCDQNNGFCSDFCLLKPEGYQCACPTGVALKFDGKNCDNDTPGKAHSWMLLTEPDSGQINNVSLSIPDSPCYLLEINKKMSRPIAVNYDPLEGKVYWTDAIGLVARAYPDGFSTEVVAYINVESPQGLAVDYIGRNLFWCDSGTNKIEVARLDGSYRTTLINSSIERPMALLLDIARRKMYWSSWGESPTIEQANMDGSARTVVVNSGLSYVNSFALDHSRGVLYWCDSGLRKIERVDLQGNNRVVTTILDLSFDNWHPYGLALSHSILYFSDWRKNAVYKYNMSSSQMNVMVQGMGSLMDLDIYDDKSSYKGSTSCSQLNGGCSHLCLPNPTGHQCFCPEGVPLKPHDRYACQGVITCGPLVPPVNAVISPPTCQSRSYYGQKCRFSCQIPGFSLVGVRYRMCGSDGKWTGSNNTRCTDITPPSFTSTCPKKLEFYAAECSSDVLVSWNEPVAIDNSGNVSVTYPAIRPPILLSSGSNRLNYIATDSSENWVNCSFNLQVITRSCDTLQPPINGNVSFSCGHWFGSKANFSCNSGYQLLGSRRRRCDEKGVWSGPPTTCTREEQSSKEETSNHLSDTWLVILIACSTMILIMSTIYISHRKFRARKHRHRPVLSCARTQAVIYEANPWEDLILNSFSTKPLIDQIRINDRREEDHCLPDSFPRLPSSDYIAKVFSSSGGVLSAARDSDIKIVIENGAIGDNQLVFYRVVDNETELLQNIPVGPDETLISPVIECGPHDIRISKPLEIIIPHCLYTAKAKKKSIIVYRTDPDPIKWEKVHDESKKNDLSRAWFTVKEDCIHIKTMTLSFWSIFSRRGPRKKRARVFVSYPESHLVHLRFYIYDDNDNSRRRVENQENQSFRSSRPASIEKPFKMYNNSKNINVRLENLKEGWALDDEADGHQEFIYLNTNGRRFRCEGTCEFLVKQIEGGVDNYFKCQIRFQQEGRVEEHTMKVIPEFQSMERPEPVNNPRQNSTETGDLQVTPTAQRHFDGAAGSSMSSVPEEGGRGNFDEKSKTPSDSVGAYKSTSSGDNSSSSLQLVGEDDLVTEKICWDISQEVGGSWKNLLRKLGLKSVTIEQLEENYNKAGVAEVCFQGLLIWMRNSGAKATRRRLRGALASPRMGRSDLLKQIPVKIAGLE